MRVPNSINVKHCTGHDGVDELFDRTRMRYYSLDTVNLEQCHEFKGDSVVTFATLSDSASAIAVRPISELWPSRLPQEVDQCSEAGPAAGLFTADYINHESSAALLHANQLSVSLWVADRRR